jgi:hypothetical protein
MINEFCAIRRRYIAKDSWMWVPDTSRGFKKDVTEKSANITLEEAKKLGEAATLARIRETPIGKNFEIEGVKLKGGNFLVKGIREV